MGTRSRVGIERADGTITSIYVHWDGYLDGVGGTLADHYTDRTKVEALIALGDLSALGEEIGEKHDFQGGGHKNWCVSYGRDRDEDDTEARESADLTAFGLMTRECNGEFAYLFTKNGEWLVNDFHTSRSPTSFEELSTALSRLESESKDG